MFRLNTYQKKIFRTTCLIFTIFILTTQLLVQEKLQINYQNIGQKLPIKLVKSNFQNWPKCSKSSMVTYYIKSHFSKGENRRNWIRSTWGRDKSLVFISLGGVLNHTNVEKSPEDYRNSDMLVINRINERRDLLSLTFSRHNLT